MPVTEGHIAWLAEWQDLLLVGRWFTDRGYTEVDLLEPTGMEYAALTLSGDLAIVSVESDRGLWGVGIRAVTSHGNDYGIEEWGECIGARVPWWGDDVDGPWAASFSEYVATIGRLRPQLDYLLRHIDTIEKACRPDRIDATIRCLRANRDARLHRDKLRRRRDRHRELHPRA